jgi:dienelactone hydrolase
VTSPVTLERSHSAHRPGAAMARGTAVGTATTMALIALLALQAAPAGARPPEDFGRHAVRVMQVRIAVPVDPSGPEGVLPWVAADVYVPVGGGPWPLVQISHAYPGTLREFPLSGWARRLASRGFVVIVSDRRAASSLAATPALDQPADLIDLSAEVNSEDILRVLRWAIGQSRVSGSPLYEKVNARRIAIAGHSLGGYLATFAAVKSQSEGPRISAVALLDPSDERLGTLSKDSALPEAKSVKVPTIVLASEENQHPVMCNMTQGTDCTLVAPQEYRALPSATPKLGVKVVGSVHEDIEDPSTIGTAESRAHLRLFQRYGMAWIEFWLGRGCGVTSYLGGRRAFADQRAGRIALMRGATPKPACHS